MLSSAGLDLQKMVTLYHGSKKMDVPFRHTFFHHPLTSGLIYKYRHLIKSEMHNDRRPSIFISIDGYGRSGKHYGMLDDCKTKTGSAGLF